MLQDPKILPKVARLESTYSPLRFAKVIDIPMEFVQTNEHFRRPPTDTEVQWMPIQIGHQWGDNWVTGWFRGSVQIPAELDGAKVYIQARPGGPETMFIVDGQAYGVFDINHPVRLLAAEAQVDQPYLLHFESYAGHTIPGTQPFSDSRSADGPVALGKDCHVFGGMDLVVERSEVSEFVFSLHTLIQIAANLDASSLRKAKIVSAMGEIFNLVPQKPAEYEEAEWRQALADACEVMRPLLEQKNAPTVPTMGVFGHSHIDTAWLWPTAETWRKLARTFSSVLSLMDEYPEFRFTQSATLHYDVVRRLYPDIFTRVQEKVKEGRWEVTGCMWIEPDCNIPDGESFVRQCLYGQRGNREMFGVTANALWQPDVFGYSAALPQILKKSGADYFLTTKLSWNDTNRFPYDTFHWQGIDGTKVLAHFNEMQGWADPERLIWLWKQVQHPDVQDRRLVGFGHGDGGGGPMAEMIEVMRLTGDLEGCPKTEYTTIAEFMDGCADDLTELPTWVGELYLELHRGTLTSIAAIKRGNRKGEIALRNAEFLSTLAFLQKGKAYPTASLDEVWKILLLNHFHDILPGSSIAEVNDQAIAAYTELFAGTDRIQSEALNSIAGTGNQVLLGNSLSWDRTGQILLSGFPAGLKPKGSVAQVVTNVTGETLLAVSGQTIPSLGLVSVETEAVETGSSPFHVTASSVETPFALVWFDEQGRITSFYDRESRRELVVQGASFNNFLMGEDVPAAWDNWDIDRDQRHKLAPLAGPIRHEVVADGPLQLRIRQEYKVGKASTLTQDIVFHADTPRVDFDTQVDWHEKYQFLKVGFTPDLLAETALHEIQFGHVQRNSHDNTTVDRAQFDVCAHKWTDISEGNYGVAFLNDCKYACTIKDGEYRLSLIKSGRHPDPRGDEGTHRFAYALLPHKGGFSVESVVRPAFEFNFDVSIQLDAAAQEPWSLLSIDQPNVIVAAVKKSEDANDLIIRLYEAGKSAGYAKLTFGMDLKSIAEVNLLEEEPVEVTLEGREAELYFRPFEIKTLRISI